MRLNQTTDWKIMTIWISRELPLFNFERLDILCSWIGPTIQKLWPIEFPKSFRCSISSVSIYYAPESDLRVKSYDHLNFSRAFVVQFRASRYIRRLNRTYEWKVITIWISRELPLFNFEHLDILCAWIGPPSSKLWSFELLRNFHYSILGISIYYAPEFDLCVKSYDNSNFQRASVVQFWMSRYIIFQIQTSVWKVMTISIFLELSLFKFERLDMLCT